MFSRISSLCTAFAGSILFLVSACQSEPEYDTWGKGDPLVMCAVNGSAEFGYKCKASRTDVAEGTVLRIYAEDGSFRRLLVTQDGRGVLAADGAEAAIITPMAGGDMIEVAIGDDRYQLPAVIK